MLKQFFFLMRGAHYWVFNGDHMTESNIPISRYNKLKSIIVCNVLITFHSFMSCRLGFPSDVQQLDAAVVWGKNKKTYFFRY